MEGGAPLFAAAGQTSAEQVVDKGTTLGPIGHGQGREQEVVRDHERAVVHLDEKIHVAVVVHDVADYQGPLGHPVQPQATERVVNMIAADHRVDGGVELEGRLFGTTETTTGMDMMHLIVADGAEDGP
jgi:hypothetical protein